VLREIDERGEVAVTAASEVLALPEARVWAAMHYYAAYHDEINAEIDEADRVSAAAEGRLARRRAGPADRHGERPGLRSAPASR
jgi:hypothetical protein